MEFVAAVGVGKEEAGLVLEDAVRERDRVLHFWRDRYGWHATSSYRGLQESAYGREASLALVSAFLHKVRFTPTAKAAIERWQDAGELAELAIVLTPVGNIKAANSTD